MSILPIVDPEFSGLIPPLSPDEREQLEHNILESRKCYDPLILWNGIIVDGHNRFEICMKHGIEFRYEEMPLDTREDAKVWILENQLNRRNLTDAARIELALLKADIVRKKAEKKQSRAGGDRKSAKYEGSLIPKRTKPGNDRISVYESTASDAGVSKGTLNNYMQIKEHGSPELQEQVQSGAIKIGAAHRLLTKEIQKQLGIAGNMLKFIKNAEPAGGYKAADPEIHSKLCNLAVSLHALLVKLGGAQ